MAAIHIVSIRCNAIQIVACIIFVFSILRSRRYSPAINRHPAQVEAVRMAIELRNEMNKALMEMGKPFTNKHEKGK